MNKLSVVGLPLPVTSAILVYSLGFVSSVKAQDKSLFAIKQTDHLTQSYFTKNKSNLDLLANNSSSLDLRLLSRNNFPRSITLQLLPTEDFNLTFTLIPEISSDFVLVPLIIESSSDIQPKLSSVVDNQNNINYITTSDRPTVDLAKLKVKADKSTTTTSNIEANNHLQSRERSVLIPNSLNKTTTSESTFIDSPVNQTFTQIKQDEKQTIVFESFTKVRDLKDVQPTDWAYNSLIRLIERYGCLSGFDDNTFRGNVSLTRYEFAAALSSCLQSIETLATDNQSTVTELAELERLKTEFESELLTVQTETDLLEQRVTFLEDRNFSPTTILRGQVDSIFASAFGDKKAVPSGETPTESLSDEVTFGSRVQLNFETSFTGKDLFRTRLEAGNINAFGSGVTGTQMTFLGAGTNTENNVRLGQIFYRFPLGDKGNAYIAGARQSASAFIPTLNRASTISLFGFNNPLYDIGFGAGGGVYYQFNDLIGAGAAYYSGSPSSPEENKGFFNGDYSALGQVTFTPADSLGLSLTYAHFFSPQPGATNNVTSFTGSQFAQLPFGGNTATASDNLNLSLSYQVSDRLELGGWLGYINANAKSSPANSGFIDFSDANADIWTSAITASYNDLGKLGSKLSLIIGIPPKLTNNDLTERQDNDTSLHLELSYNYPLTEQISLKPGVLAITNPEHNSQNDSIAIGLLQTTFSF